MMRTARRKILPALITLVALASLSGCGLEYYFLLNPPNAIYGTSTDGAFQFSAGSANNEFEFLGFELYYKFYRPGVDTPENSINTLDELTSKSFRRLNNLLSDTKTSRSYPLFWSAFSKGTDYTVTIDFSTPGNPVVSATVTPQREITGLRRGVYLPSPDDSYFKPFSNYDSTDADITTDLYNNYINFTPAQNVTLVLYVLSYGKDASTGLELYSQPKYLGDKLLTFPNLSYP